MEDLQALYALCGGNDAEVVVLLSRMWRLPREEIRPTVLGWLKSLPRPELPSRSRSAPAVLPRALEERLASAVMCRPAAPAAADHGALPAASAPVSRADLSAVLHGLHAADARVRASQQWNGVRTGPDGELLSPRAQIYTLPQQPSFAPVLSVAAVAAAAVPEDEPVHNWAEGRAERYHDAALEAFMARTMASKKELSPTVRGGRDRGTTRMRM